MTKEEIKEFLNETKVYVNGKSEKIQEKLFSLGYLWIIDDKPIIQDVGKPFIFIDKGLKLTNGDDMLYFEQHRYREITAEEILALEITEKYRPFKDIKECWEEMMKHEPFGWICPKNIFIPEVAALNVTGVTTVEGYHYRYSVMLDKYNFADGTPFGIKEE